MQLIVQNDAAHAVVNKLGQVGLVQFRDLNAGTSFYKRSFVEEVRKCDDLERILRSISEEYDENSTIVIAERDEKLSLSLSLEDVEGKLHSIEEELSELKAQQEVGRPSPPTPLPKAKLISPPSPCKTGCLFAAPAPVPP